MALLENLTTAAGAPIKSAAGASPVWAGLKASMAKSELAADHMAKTYPQHCIRPTLHRRTSKQHVVSRMW